MATVKEKPNIPVLVDTELETLLRKLVALRTAKKSLEVEEKGKGSDPEDDGLVGLIKAALKPYSDEYADSPKLQIGKVTVSLVAGKTSRVDKELLLKAGVKPQVIEDCTYESHYTRVAVTVLKDNGNGDGE